MKFNDAKYFFHKIINQIPYDFSVWWDSEYDTFCGTVSLDDEIVFSTDCRISTIKQLEIELKNVVIPERIKNELCFHEPINTNYDTNIKPTTYGPSTISIGKNNIQLALEKLFE